MGKYNGLSVSGTFKVPAWLIAAAVAGCASQPGGGDSYIVNVPATQAQPAETQPAPVPVTAPMPAAEVSEAPRLREDAPLKYVVKKGDTLWGIANHFLLDAWQWPEIWYVNDQIKNPHLIYPGDVLSLVYVNGKPRLLNGEVGTSLAAAGKTERLQPRVRESSLESAIPAIPIEAIRDFLAAPRLVTADELRQAPYVVDFVDPQLVAGAGSHAYIKNLPESNAFAYSIVRAGKTYRDPDSGELLGYEAIPVGNAEIREYGELATASLVRTVREVRAGDRLLPLEEDSLDAYFYPKAPAKAVSGRIISVLDGMSQIGQYQVVTLNRGASSGLERGDVLTIMQAGRIARDPDSSSADTRIKLPDVPAGTLMVFKTTPKVSYGLVMSATRQIHRLDKVESPKSLR